MTKEQIDQKYLNKATQLEAEYFDIQDEGKPSQCRQLKAGKTIEDFSLSHGKIWHDHEAELVAGGFLQPVEVEPPPRDLEKEIDDLKARVENLEV